MAEGDLQRKGNLGDSKDDPGLAANDHVFDSHRLNEPTLAFPKFSSCTFPLSVNNPSSLIISQHFCVMDRVLISETSL